MKKLWNGFIWLFVLSGFPLLVWAGFGLASETYAFWRYGTEKVARVVALDHTSRAPKGGTTFYYLIEIDGHRFVKDFRVRLPEGGEVAVLSLPEDPNNVVIGTSKSTAFEIFSYSIGGKVWAVLVLAMFCFMIWAGPKALVAWIKARREIIAG
ncbi:ABC transporter permease [Peristeroidobacter soli]|jgi:hypothetical protein|uniref:ABC transporter permease n=1 Tax=Peristeroidobacter soli TaxID=2497877 RepID=UPI00101E0A5E|nr:ABC transporter permease [Peristeroidobacter soli]